LYIFVAIYFIPLILHILPFGEFDDDDDDNDDDDNDMANS